jgi:ATP-dependent helicase/nuclease subunit A
MTANRSPQIEASNPGRSVFVSANAGTGKTYTLVTRVARLLLDGAEPDTILCVTFTKAGAAEMQTRLFKTLGEWAVMEDEALRAALARIDETGRDLAAARRLFARALETPGGLKIQTIHAFCEKLLRRFPLEAGVAPGFTVLEDAAALAVSTRAREALARHVLDHPDGVTAAAYDRLSVELDWRAFNVLFADIENARMAIAAYMASRDWHADIWERCGFARPADPTAIERDALKRTQTARWRRMAEAVAASPTASDRNPARLMRLLSEGGDFADYRALFLTKDGQPRAKPVSTANPKAVRDYIAEEQQHCLHACESAAGARLAIHSIDALTLAGAYASLYAAAKGADLDFGDLIVRSLELVTERAEAAWVLYKLDNGLTHVLLDEAQDTAAIQWGVLRALTAEFFHGEGVEPPGRTLFAVGDEKQSIFSFQGAAPETLAGETGAFERMIGTGFRRLPLQESRRSAPEILQFVDQVFADQEAMAGLHAHGANVLAKPLEHTTIRKDHGCVDLWPMVQGEKADGDADPWWTPVDKEPVRSANRLLAARLAGAVAAMVDAGETVAGRENGAARACRYGDFMILVRRRGPLFDEIIRALKRAGVPVAGADRLKLAEHGLYADFMALLRFVGFPSDDLSLAVLLRSPFCEVDEESLFDLAHGREGRPLWAELGRRTGERPEWESAHAFLAFARESAAGAAPFDFLLAVLACLDADGRSMRQRILTRLGVEGEQALEAFMGETLASEASGVRDLERLTDWMGGLDIDIKREQQEAGGDVRVMTVHGAKGLEAPIVILPDTTIRATWQGGRLMALKDGAFLLAPLKADECESSAVARAARDEAVTLESARLLYVALTRARDRLIVAGVEAKGKVTQRSWYDFAARAFDVLPSQPFPLPGGGEGRRFGPAPMAVGPARSDPAARAIPDWVRRLAPGAAPAGRRASPSHIDEGGIGATISPLAAGLGRYRRGDLIHRLLQLLPDLPPPDRAAAAARLLAREHDLTAVQRAEMAAAALAVLTDPLFAAVFGPGSRAEVPVVGEVAGLAISGRVDRLLVETDRVLVVDFKTNRPAPKAIADADPEYVRQMAVYAAVLAEVFPGRGIEAALVWTDGPSLMPVPTNMMRQALTSLSN